MRDGNGKGNKYVKSTAFPNKLVLRRYSQNHSNIAHPGTELSLSMKGHDMGAGCDITEVYSMIYHTCLSWTRYEGMKHGKGVIKRFECTMRYTRGTVTRKKPELIRISLSYRDQDSG